MAKKTVLDMVQDILDGLGLDAVNSIDDTEDASKVARIIRKSYFDLAQLREFPEHNRMGTLNASTDDQRPTHMSLPDNCAEIYSIKYNISSSTETRQRFVDIDYLPPERFLAITYQRNDTNANVQVVLDYDENRKVFIQTDKKPQYWTMWDGDHIIFDSFDSGVDDTIQSSKCVVYMRVEPPFTMTDTFVPDLSSKSFGLLQSEAARAASIKVAQAVDEEEERKSRRLFIKNAWDKHRVNGGIKYPNYGRK